MRKRYPAQALTKPRAYGDFRDVGGGLEPLIVPGDHCATMDPRIAEKLAADRLLELEESL